MCCECLLGYFLSSIHLSMLEFANVRLFSHHCSQGWQRRQEEWWRSTHRTISHSHSDTHNVYIHILYMHIDVLSTVYSIPESFANSNVTFFYLTKTIVLFSVVAKFQQLWTALEEKCRGLDLITQNSHTCAEQQRWGIESDLFACLFLCLPFLSVAALIGEWAAWCGGGMRQRQPMRCAIPLSHRPSLIPARRPCLYASAVMPVVSHSTGAVCNVCMCVCWRMKFVCRCLDKSIETPSPHVSIGGGGGGGAGGGSTAPFERLLSFPSIQPPSMPLLHSPADIFLETCWMN